MEFLTVRVPRSVTEELRAIAHRESETQSTIVRRLLRVGLLAEKREASR
jgi:hypothetical protein